MIKVVRHYATIASIEIFHNKREIGQHKFRLISHNEKSCFKTTLGENETMKYYLISNWLNQNFAHGSQHICLVDTETTKVPAVDLYKNSKSKKICPFLITKKIEHIHQKIKIWASWAVKWAVIWMAHTISHWTNT